MKKKKTMEIIENFVLVKKIYFIKERKNQKSRLSSRN
jgi:hypothetical protein